MSTEIFITQAELWLWKSDKAPAAWHFLTIKGDVADAIRLSALMVYGKKRGFGSVKIEAKIGATIWRTSLFPHKESNGWILPVKADVRKAEGILVGDMVQISIGV